MRLEGRGIGGWGEVGGERDRRVGVRLEGRGIGGWGEVGGEGDRRVGVRLEGRGIGGWGEVGGEGIGGWGEVGGRQKYTNTVGVRMYTFSSTSLLYSCFCDLRR